MKIMLLSDCNSVHTIKWATSLSKNNLDVIIFSLGALKVDDYKNTNVKVVDFSAKISRKGIFNKVGYLKALPYLKKIIKKEQPNIVHAHYATSYGLLGALSRFNPFILSVWGADVFDFPKKSFIHKMIIKHNLKKADKILSTSKVMAKQTNKFTSQNIEVTPFGIDIDIFKPVKEQRLFEDKDIVIGTIKMLEEKYGIQYLIEAFKVLVDKHPTLPLKLLLVGGGSLGVKMKKLVKELNLEEKVLFTGNVPFVEVPKYHNMIDVYVALSILDSESFGVAIVEASSCEKPVVVSNVGGLPEVVANDITGIVVPKKDAQSAAKAIEKLVLNEGLRVKMGQAGRQRVREKYNWENNVMQMINIYKNILK